MRLAGASWFRKACMNVNQARAISGLALLLPVSSLQFQFGPIRLRTQQTYHVHRRRKPSATALADGSVQVGVGKTARTVLNSPGGKNVQILASASFWCRKASVSALGETLLAGCGGLWRGRLLRRLPGGIGRFRLRSVAAQRSGLLFAGATVATGGLCGGRIRRWSHCFVP